MEQEISKNTKLNNPPPIINKDDTSHFNKKNIKGKSVILKCFGKQMAIVSNNTCIPLNDLKVLSSFKELHIVNKQKNSINEKCNKLENFRMFQNFKTINLKNRLSKNENIGLKTYSRRKSSVSTNTDDKLMLEVQCQTDIINEPEPLKTVDRECQTDINMFEPNKLFINEMEGVNIANTPCETITDYLDPDSLLNLDLLAPTYAVGNTDNFYGALQERTTADFGNYARLMNCLNRPPTEKDMYKYNMYQYFLNCDICDADGYLPIHRAVEKGNVTDLKRQCVVLNIKRKTIDFLTPDRNTPLLLAVLCNSSIEIIDVLLKYRSSLEPQDSDGNSIIHLAVMNNNQDVLIRLLEVSKELNYDINCCNFEGLTPLMIAIINENCDLTLHLLNYGGDPNIQAKKDGKTSLFHAIATNNVQMVNILLSHGADTNVCNFVGMNCRDVVFELDVIHEDIKNLILLKSEVKRYIKSGKSNSSKRSMYDESIGSNSSPQKRRKKYN